MNKTPPDGTPVRCELCPHHCRIASGQFGFCQARTARSGRIVPLYYGKSLPLALDPIEKKPFAAFYPGTMILSAGGLGCNMTCPYCQNHVIAGQIPPAESSRYLLDYTPADLIREAEQAREQHNIGIAFTYNEPLINFEYVLDTFKLVRADSGMSDGGLKTALVSNGQICEPYLQELLPYVDAWNIDLKCFTAEGYRKLGGELEAALRTIEQARAVSHVEVTSLIVPGLNDSEAEMQAQCRWLASVDPDIPLHLSRFFPSHRMQAAAPTPLGSLSRLRSIAQEYLSTVLLGNVPAGW